MPHTSPSHTEYPLNDLIGLSVLQRGDRAHALKVNVAAVCVQPDDLDEIVKSPGIDDNSRALLEDVRDALDAARQPRLKWRSPRVRDVFAELSPLSFASSFSSPEQAIIEEHEQAEELEDVFDLGEWEFDDEPPSPAQQPQSEPESPHPEDDNVARDDVTSAADDDLATDASDDASTYDAVDHPSPPNPSSPHPPTLIDLDDGPVSRSLTLPCIFDSAPGHAAHPVSYASLSPISAYNLNLEGIPSTPAQHRTTDAPPPYDESEASTSRPPSKASTPFGTPEHLPLTPPPEAHELPVDGKTAEVEADVAAEAGEADLKEQEEATLPPPPSLQNESPTPRLPPTPMSVGASPTRDLPEEEPEVLSLSPAEEDIEEEVEDGGAVSEIPSPVVAQDDVTVPLETDDAVIPPAEDDAASSESPPPLPKDELAVPIETDDAAIPPVDDGVTSPESPPPPLPKEDLVVPPETHDVAIPSVEDDVASPEGPPPPPKDDTIPVLAAEERRAVDEPVPTAPAEVIPTPSHVPLPAPSPTSSPPDTTPPLPASERESSVQAETEAAHAPDISAEVAPPAPQLDVDDSSLAEELLHADAFAAQLPDAAASLSVQKGGKTFVVRPVFERKTSADVPYPRRGKAKHVEWVALLGDLDWAALATPTPGTDGERGDPFEDDVPPLVHRDHEIELPATASDAGPPPRSDGDVERDREMGGAVETVADAGGPVLEAVGEDSTLGNADETEGEADTAQEAAHAAGTDVSNIEETPSIVQDEETYAEASRDLIDLGDPTSVPPSPTTIPLPDPDEEELEFVSSEPLEDAIPLQELEDVDDVSGALLLSPRLVPLPDTDDVDELSDPLPPSEMSRDMLSPASSTLLTPIDEQDASPTSTREKAEWPDLRVPSTYPTFSLYPAQYPYFEIFPGYVSSGLEAARSIIASAVTPMSPRSTSPALPAISPPTSPTVPNSGLRPAATPDAAIRASRGEPVNEVPPRFSNNIPIVSPRSPTPPLPPRSPFRKPYTNAPVPDSRRPEPASSPTASTFASWASAISPTRASPAPRPLPPTPPVKAGGFFGRATLGGRLNRLISNIIPTEPERESSPKPTSAQALHDGGRGRSQVIGRRPTEPQVTAAPESRSPAGYGLRDSPHARSQEAKRVASEGSNAVSDGPRADSRRHVSSAGEAAEAKPTSRRPEAQTTSLTHIASPRGADSQKLDDVEAQKLDDVGAQKLDNVEAPSTEVLEAAAEAHQVAPASTEIVVAEGAIAEATGPPVDFPEADVNRQTVIQAPGIYAERAMEDVSGTGTSALKDEAFVEVGQASEEPVADASANVKSAEPKNDSDATLGNASQEAAVDVAEVDAPENETPPAVDLVGQEAVVDSSISRSTSPTTGDASITGVHEELEPSVLSQLPVGPTKPVTEPAAHAATETEPTDVVPIAGFPETPSAVKEIVHEVTEPSIVVDSAIVQDLEEERRTPTPLPVLDVSSDVTRGLPPLPTPPSAVLEEVRDQFGLGEPVLDKHVTAPGNTPDARLSLSSSTARRGAPRLPPPLKIPFDDVREILGLKADDAENGVSALYSPLFERHAFSLPNGATKARRRMSVPSISIPASLTQGAPTDDNPGRDSPLVRLKHGSRTKRRAASPSDPPRTLFPSTKLDWNGRPFSGGHRRSRSDSAASTVPATLQPLPVLSPVVEEIQAHRRPDTKQLRRRSLPALAPVIAPGHVSGPSSDPSLAALLADRSALQSPVAEGPVIARGNGDQSIKRRSWPALAPNIERRPSMDPDETTPTMGKFLANRSELQSPIIERPVELKGGEDEVTAGGPLSVLFGMYKAARVRQA